MDNYILEIPDALPKELCHEIINKFESDENKEQGKIGDNKIVDLSLKKSIDLYVTPSDEKWVNISHKLYDTLFKCLNKYICYVYDNFSKMPPIYNDIFLNKLIFSNYNIQKIEKNDQYVWHYDNPSCPDKIGVLNCIVYLNTLELDSGNTEFGHGRKIRPETGKVLFFPSTWTFPHRGNVVKNDSKYILSLGVFSKQKWLM